MEENYGWKFIASGDAMRDLLKDEGRLAPASSTKKYEEPILYDNETKNTYDKEAARKRRDARQARREQEKANNMSILRKIVNPVVCGTLAGVVAISAFVFSKINSVQDDQLTGISMEEVQDAIDNRELNEQKIADAKAASDVYDKIAAGEKETLTQEDLNAIEGFDQNDYKPENYEQGMATPETKVNTFEEQPKEEIKHVNTFSTLDGYPPLNEGISR